MKQILISSVVGLLAAFVVGVSPAAAETCTHECETAVGCHGGCQISDLDGCVCAAWGGGCGYECKWFGPGDCPDGVAGRCHFEPPPEFTAESGEFAEWALLSYEPPAIGDDEASRVTALAASSGEFATVAVEERREALQERRDAMRSEQRSSRDLRDDQTASARVLHVQPLVPCLDFTASLDTAAKPLPAEPDAVLYFKAITDGRGKIASIEPLYSNRPEKNGSMSAFLVKNLRLESAEPLVPVGFFGVLRVQEERVGYALAGAYRAPAGVELVPRHPVP